LQIAISLLFFLVSYVHAPGGLAKVATLVALEGKEPEGLARKLAVHIAGMNPKSNGELLEQDFGAWGGGLKVAEALTKHSLALNQFVRLEVGEGIEVEEEDYAEAVKSAMKV
jgi:elongation factor Ts